MKSYIIFAVILFGLFVSPHVSQAYFTTSQSAQVVGNDTILFTVTYQFGFLNRKVYMPIEAKRNKDFTDKGLEAGYSILIDGEAKSQATTSKLSNTDMNISLNYSVLPGKARAIVLSDAEIKDGRYYLPKGKAGTFTLVALVDMSNADNTEDISLRMTSLPFTMIDKKERIEARLNPSELQYYSTKELDLK